MPRAPKENPLRRNVRVSGPVDLPAAGRSGRTPKWPLAYPPTMDERQAWVELWRTPQSVMWETLGWTRTVARYCRLMVEAERPSDPLASPAAFTSPALLGQVTALEDRLGLTPKAMRLLLWRIAADEVAEQREVKSTGGAKRLRAVDSG